MLCKSGAPVIFTFIFKTQTNLNFFFKKSASKFESVKWRKQMFSAKYLVFHYFVIILQFFIASKHVLLKQQKT